jgi:hypothetical protein
MHSFDASYQKGTLDYEVKAKALFHYASFDEHMVSYAK